MKITKKLIKIAFSFGVIIDKPIIEKLKLKEGEFIELDIKRYKEEK